MKEKAAIKDLEFIRDAYKNLAEHGAESVRAVGNDIDCEADIKTYGELYSHFAESAELAIKAIDKQIPKKPDALYKKAAKYGICSTCETGVNSSMKYCYNCGRAILWDND